MKKGKRVKHHHHRMTSLLLQYSHLNEEQRLDAFEADVLRLAEMMDKEHAAKVLDKIANKLRSKPA